MPVRRTKVRWPISRIWLSLLWLTTTSDRKKMIGSLRLKTNRKKPTAEYIARSSGNIFCYSSGRPFELNNTNYNHITHEEFTLLRRSRFAIGAVWMCLTHTLRTVQTIRARACRRAYARSGACVSAVMMKLTENNDAVHTTDGSANGVIDFNEYDYSKEACCQRPLRMYALQPKNPALKQRR